MTFNVRLVGSHIIHGDEDYTVCKCLLAKPTGQPLTAYLVLISNEEDYRWQIVRGTMPSWLFQIINLTFTGMFKDCCKR